MKGRRPNLGLARPSPSAPRARTHPPFLGVKRRAGLARPRAGRVRGGPLVRKFFETQSTGLGCGCSEARDGVGAGITHSCLEPRGSGPGRFPPTPLRARGRAVPASRRGNSHEHAPLRVDGERLPRRPPADIQGARMDPARAALMTLSVRNVSLH